MGSDHILQLGVARHLVDLVKDLIYNASVRIYRRAEDHCDHHNYLYDTQDYLLLVLYLFVILSLQPNGNSNIGLNLV